MPVRGKNGGNKGQGSKWITRKRRLAIYARDAWRCVWCCAGVVLPTGGTGDGTATLDHVVPREHGGDNTTPNLVTCCMRCNRLRASKTVYEFAMDLFYTHRLVGSVATAIARVLRAVLSPLDGKPHDPPLDSLPSVRALEKLLARNKGGEVGGD